jgi:thiol:disulfide interchange protein DsbC
MINLRTVVAAIVFVSALGMSSAEAADDIAAVRAGLAKILQDVPISAVKATDIPGVYEVESLYDVFYYAAKPEQLIFGEVFSRDGNNITVRSKDAIVARTISTLDLSKAIKSGAGSNIVIEFTDPDCPHCRDAFEYWRNVPDVTRYTFLTPNTETHPQATDKSEWILSHKDPIAAINAVFSGKHDKEIPKGATEAGKLLLKEHARFAANAYVIGTPLYFVNGKLLPGVNIEAFEAALLPLDKSAETSK